MLNIIGITLSFIGTLLTLATLVFSKTNKETAYDDLLKIGFSQHKTKWFSIAGLLLITIGFLLQLYVASKAL